MRRIVDVAQGLEGIVRNNSIHAAAVVIADRPLDEIVPLQLAEDRGAAAEKGANGKPERQYKIVTQYSMGPIEEIGLLKMDFLGLRNLDVIEDAVEIIRRSRGVEVEMESIPLDDAKTYEMLARGDSVGVFQLESEGMREALKQIRPTEFNDIVAIGALYRPGAMRFIADYARGKRNPASVTYQDPRLRPITEETYGCCIYQEQLMEISKQLGGFTPAEADDLRKAVGKKKRDLMATMEDKFIEGCASSGTAPAVAKDLWSLMTAAADYSFNKSHAACYALISYRTAYLKANYPAEYMAAVISSVMSTKDKVPFFVNRCEEMGIEVLPPDVNSSDHGFVVSRQLDPLRPRRGQERRPRRRSRRSSRRARRAGEFESIWDFCERVDARAVNKRAIECLVKCGALDSTGATRRGDARGPRRRRSRRARRRRRTRRRGQGSIFDLGDPGGPAADRGAAAFAAPSHPPIPDGRVRPARAAAAREGDARDLPLRASADRGPRRAARPGRAAALGGGRDAGRRLGDGRRNRQRGEEGPHPQRRLRDVRDARRPRGRRSSCSSATPPARRREAIEVDRVVVVRGRVDHKGRGETSLVVHEAEAFEPDAGRARGGAGEGGRGTGPLVAADQRRRVRAPR